MHLSKKIAGEGGGKTTSCVQEEGKEEQERENPGAEKGTLDLALLLCVPISSSLTTEEK